MTVFLCVTCGTSYPASDHPPDHCVVCEDERQFVPASGQAWTTRESLAATHRNAWQLHEPGLMSVQTVPDFGIGQRAFLLMTPAGNFLWDCIALLDPATETLIRGLGGLAGIAISHPHFYTTVQDWAAAFEVPVHLHLADRDSLIRPSPRVQFWEGNTREIAPGLTLIHLGGHFPGSSVLHWAAGASGAGVLLPGDTVQVTPGGHRVSFMWSFPNFMPLPASTVCAIAERLSVWRFDRIYGLFGDRNVRQGAAAMVASSAARYAELLETPLSGHSAT
jgi:glyoxylase-like metal-dependent hydrolase (beta-lactamase superfamily II)